jgi:hypothetical protein
MTETKKSFFGANDAQEEDDFRVASSVILGDNPGNGSIDVDKLTIKLWVFDGETKERHIVPIKDTEQWNWKAPGIWRVINGWQVSSYRYLVALLHQKQEKGVEEIEILVAPRFSMLSGG